MRLNLKTDYALRILLYAAKASPRLVTAKEVAENFNFTHSNSNQIYFSMSELKAILKAHRATMV